MSLNLLRGVHRNIAKCNCKRSLSFSLDLIFYLNVTVFFHFLKILVMNSCVCYGRSFANQRLRQQPPLNPKSSKHYQKEQLETNQVLLFEMSPGTEYRPNSYHGYDRYGNIGFVGTGINCYRSVCCDHSGWHLVGAESDSINISGV
jgi:hypothetical protein